MLNRSFWLHMKRSNRWRLIVEVRDSMLIDSDGGSRSHAFFMVMYRRGLVEIEPCFMGEGN